MELKSGQQYRVTSDGAILTVGKIVGDNMQFSIFRDNKDNKQVITVADFKSLIGQGKLTEVGLHKYKDNKLAESRFGRAMGKFTDYASKVISMLRRNNIDENMELDLGLISSCFAQNMNSRDCANAYLKSLNKTIKEAIAVKEVQPGFYSDPNGDRFYQDAKKNLYKQVDGVWHVCTEEGEAEYPIHTELTIMENKEMNEDLMSSLVGMGYGSGGSRTAKKVTFQPGEKALFKDPNDNKTKKVEIEYEEEHKGETIYNLIYLNPADDIGTGYAYSYQLKKLMGENKNIKMKTKLNETSHEIASPKYMVNYEEQDVVTAIKAAFENYEGCTCSKIAAVGDSQFYNVNVTVNADDEYTDLEAKRFMISQKVHKVRAELFADLSSVLPVVNINMANYAFTKNEDKVTFNLTILMSNTNQRDWVTGEYKQKDKKLSDKLDKILDAKSEKFIEEAKAPVKKKINESDDFLEFKLLINKIASNVFSTINSEVDNIQSDMPYKAQYVLEKVIQILEKQV